MKTALKSLVIFLCLAALVSGCAGKPTKLPEAKTLAQALADRAGGGGELSEVPDNVMLKLLMLAPDALTEGAMVMDASRATTTQFVVLTARDEAQAKTLEAQLKDYQAMVLEQYRDYVPSEVPRIEKALIRRQGAQTVFVICDEPEKAEQVLKDHWK